MIRTTALAIFLAVAGPANALTVELTGTVTHGQSGAVRLNGEPVDLTLNFSPGYGNTKWYGAGGDFSGTVGNVHVTGDEVLQSFYGSLWMWGGIYGNFDTFLVHAGPTVFYFDVDQALFSDPFPPAGVTGIPEPATWALMLLGLIGFAAVQKTSAPMARHLARQL